MQKIRLKRTKRDDLVFSGVLLASVDDQDHGGSDFSWLKLLLYQTSTRAYILGVTLHWYSSSGRKDLSSAVAFDSIEDVREFLCREKCRYIAHLKDNLLKRAAKTKKAYRNDTVTGIRTFFEPQAGRSAPGYAVAP